MSEVIDGDPVGPVIVKRWRRFGMDRLYVNEADGCAVGWFDLETGKREIGAPESAEFFEHAVEDWLSADPGLGPPKSMPMSDRSNGQISLPHSRPTSLPGGLATSDQTTVARSSNDDAERWVDLAENLPGQSVRAQAIAEQRSQPVVTWLARALGVHTSERAWRMGEKGEELVANELARLPDGWLVLHSIPVGDNGSDIDHLVIGPAGVFSINTKHHKNASIWVASNVFMVNGQRQPYLRNSRHEAARASRLLSVACAMPVKVRGSHRRSERGTRSRSRSDLSTSRSSTAKSCSSGSASRAGCWTGLPSRGSLRLPAVRRRGRTQLGVRESWPYWVHPARAALVRIRSDRVRRRGPHWSTRDRTVLPVPPGSALSSGS